MSSNFRARANNQSYFVEKRVLHWRGREVGILFDFQLILVCDQIVILVLLSIIQNTRWFDCTLCWIFDALGVLFGNELLFYVLPRLTFGGEYKKEAQLHLPLCIFLTRPFQVFSIKTVLSTPPHSSSSIVYLVIFFIMYFTFNGDCFQRLTTIIILSLPPLLTVFLAICSVPFDGKHLSACILWRILMNNR